MEDNLELLIRAKEGDDNAKEKLVEQNLGLVWSIARRFTGRGYDIEDLYQIGCIGLLKCIDRFDDSYNVKFSTYAVPLIQGEIRRFLRDDGAIKVSRSLKTTMNKVEAYRQKVIKEKGIEPGIEEIAAEISISPCDIVMAMEAAYKVESLDSPGLVEKPSEKENDIIEMVMLSQMLDALPDEERKLINLRFFRDKTQSQTGRELGLSQVQVSRLEKKILDKMKKQILE
ncbi:MAG: sigma-70 family RNA polymerase sigma factor [Coprococcus sp.]|nr:sigma-70 family RNA polymerase sigma factor [Coprococcus sp.]